MKWIRRIMSCILLFLFCLRTMGQETDSIIEKLTGYAYAINSFSRYLPQEKVYLHFDNASYYQGDDIWFKCYLVSSGLRPANELSKTLYVELLNPGGEIIDKQILKVDKAQCHGNFTLDRLPFYSGFYEIRAYTKYMLNFGEDVIFSRLLPVFDKPKEEGDFTENKMQSYTHIKYPMKRKKPQKDKAVNLKFFPEGGNLVQGISSRVAFEATDAFGNPIDVTGVVFNDAKEEISRFSTFHEGRGVFSYLPLSGKKGKVEVEYNGKKYQFDMPVAAAEGYVLQVDNLSCSDSIAITIQKRGNTLTDNMLGAVLLNNGNMRNFSVIEVPDDETISFKTSKAKLTPGVSRFVLFNSKGEPLSDRLLFTNNSEVLRIKAQTAKEKYEPHALVDMEFTLTDSKEKPVQFPFSVSVKDGMNEIESAHNIQTNLLLMSEIKGYVRNPSYYFEADDSLHREALDQLLMVQGWRRYSWEHLSGKEPFDLKYKPEQGIEIQGEVVSFVRGKPMPNVDISYFLTKRGEEDEKKGTFVNTFTTDKSGKFTIVSNLVGKWNMVLSVSEKGKKKDHRIMLDRVFNPEPRQYRYTDLQVTQSVDPEKEEIAAEEGENESGITEEELNKLLSAYEDSLAKVGIDEKVHRLEEVTVTADKRSRERDIYMARTKSVAYYDLASEVDNMTDQGKFVGKNLHEILFRLNDNFMYQVHTDMLLYKGKPPLFVIDYEPTYQEELNDYKYKVIRPGAIKSIYISEDLPTIVKYADPKATPFEISSMYNCVILIELYPDGYIPADAGRGVRKTWLDGYSPVKEFYSSDYSVLPPEPDYRRTLYWNPSVMPDKDGKANIQFYNNSRCRKFKISAEMITLQGIIGMYKE